MEGYNMEVNNVQDLKFFESPERPGIIYITFFKDGKDYFFAIDRDLDKDGVLLDKELNKELFEGLKERSAPENSKQITNYALGEIEYQEHLDRGQDTSYD